MKNVKHQDNKIQITKFLLYKSPHFFEANHHHHTILESPNHHVIWDQTTISP